MKQLHGLVSVCGSQANDGSAGLPEGQWSKHWATQVSQVWNLIIWNVSSWKKHSQQGAPNRFFRIRDLHYLKAATQFGGKIWVVIMIGMHI